MSFPALYPRASRGLVTRHLLRLKSGADPNVMDDSGAKPGDVFHDGVSMSQRFEIKKLLRQRYNLMGECFA